MKQFVVHRYFKQYSSEYQHDTNYLGDADVMSEVKDTDPHSYAFPNSAHQRVNMLSEKGNNFEDEHGAEGMQNGKYSDVQEKFIMIEGKVDSVRKLP